MQLLKLNESDQWAQRRVLWLLGLTLLPLIAILLNHTLDHWIEDQFYLGGGIWVAEKTIHTTAYFIFYRLPKMMLIWGGVLMLLKALLHFKNRKIARGMHYLLAIFAMSVLPALISFLKNISQVPCPHNLLEYGGTEPAQSLISFIIHRNSDAGKCFPAGHAAGGFAVLGLLFLARNRREARYIIIAGLVAGWILGLYQQARGAHFLSHTIMTQFLALAFIWGLYKLFYRKSHTKV